MKVLINVPDLTCPGGVSKYFQTVSGKFHTQVEYHTIGSRIKKNNFVLQFWRMISDYFHFFKKINIGGYEIIHLNPSLGLKAVIRDGIFLLLAKSSHAKTIIFWHGWNEDFYKKICGRPWTKYLFTKIFFTSDAFIVLASDIKAKLVDLGYHKPIFLETTLISEEDISNKGIAAIQENKYYKESVNILFLSTIIKEKGIYEAIDGYRILKRKCESVFLQIAGDGRELLNAKTYVNNKQIPGITFSGYLTGDEKKEAFLNADIYLFPSYSEGMPISILEAMAYGLPIVTTNVGGIKDFFVEGKMGFFIEAKNTKSLADLLKVLIENKNLRQEISLHNYNYARKTFLASKVLDRLENIYSKISVTF